MPLYAEKYAICAFLQNMRNMLRSHDRYKPLSLVRTLVSAVLAMQSDWTDVTICCSWNQNFCHSS